MFNKILVPIDGSAVGSAAVAQAMSAVGPSTKVVLMQVVDSPERIYAHATPAGFEFSSAIVDQRTIDTIVSVQREAASEHLAAARDQLAQAGIANTETRITEGLPGDEIVRLAREDGFDLIIMGTHGRSGLTRTVLGSVAEYVVRHLRGIPVMLVHPSDA